MPNRYMNSFRPDFSSVLRKKEDGASGNGWGGGFDVYGQDNNPAQGGMGFNHFHSDNYDTQIESGDFGDTVIGSNDDDTVLDNSVTASLYDVIHRQTINWYSNVCTIGRDANCDIVISNEKASRHHGEIRKYDNVYVLVDTNSKNGIKLNGQRLNANLEYQLKNNDEIVITSDKFIFKQD